MAYLLFMHTRLNCIAISRIFCKKSLNIPIIIRKSKKNRQHNGQKKKEQKDKQRSTKHTHKTKDRVMRTPLSTGGEPRCSRRVGSYCSSSDTCRRVNLVTNPVISHECGKDREVLTTSGTYPWSFVTQKFHSGQPCHYDFNLTKRNQ